MVLIRACSLAELYDILNYEIKKINTKLFIQMVVSQQYRTLSDCTDVKEIRASCQLKAYIVLEHL